MSTQSEIDETLGLLGSAQPPSGIESRIKLRLQAPRRSLFFSISRFQAIAAGALAASVGLSAAALNPALRNLVFHHAGATAPMAVSVPRVAVPSSGGFGTASAVHVPVEPVPVQPTPVNQGRGRSRSGRVVLPNGAVAPLPRGVAAPH